MLTETWLKEATLKLQLAGIESPRLDCLILLEYITKRDRAWLLAHPDISLSATQQQKLTELIDKRTQRWPIAYLVGYKEFYGLGLIVNPSVLIPRPETEEMIEQFINLFDHKPPVSKVQPWKMVDVGTGSGAIALAIKQKYPQLQITATDTSPEALKIAQINAKKHDLQINFVRTNLLDNLDKFNAIAANLPYAAKEWPVSPETAFEPSVALYAPQEGMELISRLMKEAPKHLLAPGYLLLEHDPRQSSQITHLASKLGYQIVKATTFTTVLQLR